MRKFILLPLLVAVVSALSVIPISHEDDSFPGGSSWPTCAMNGLPCPVPVGWEAAATWNLTQSTMIQPSSEGYFMPQHPWGLISLDWSVARNIWYQNSTKTTDCEAVSVHGCRLLKAAGLAHRCFIYHNMELALEWLESQRAVMYDPSKADWFLQYTNAHGHKNGTIYNEPQGLYGDQYFWDFRNEAASAYFVSSIVRVLEDPAVDGTFTDDVTGVPAEHERCPSAIGMNSTALAALQLATAAASQTLITALSLSGKGNWQAFGSQDAAGPAPTQATCLAFMREFCQPSYQGRMMTMQMDSSPANKEQTVAAFLVTRPPVAYLGWGWESDDSHWDDIFLLQVGTPIGLCQERIAGVFTRDYSLGTARLDCRSWTSDLPFSSL